MKRTATRGFTIVELVVVIAVLAILVAITAALYQSAQAQARDAKNADGADKLADAIQLFIAKNQHFPAGGWGSTSPIGAATECALPAASGFAAKGTYTCTIDDTLVASGYLPVGFLLSLSPNPNYTQTNGFYSTMVYQYGQKALVMYSMEDPSSDDTAHFNQELAKCLGSVPASYGPRDTYGMRNGLCISFQTF